MGEVGRRMVRLSHFRRREAVARILPGQDEIRAHRRFKQYESDRARSSDSALATSASSSLSSHRRLRSPRYTPPSNERYRLPLSGVSACTPPGPPGPPRWLGLCSNHHYTTSAHREKNQEQSDQRSYDLRPLPAPPRSLVLWTISHIVAGLGADP